MRTNKVVLSDQNNWKRRIDIIYSKELNSDGTYTHRFTYICDDNRATSISSSSLNEVIELFDYFLSPRPDFPTLSLYNDALEASDHDTQVAA